MHIYSVNDPEFKSYGNVWDNVPSELTSPVLDALSATPIPEGSKYVASAPELEGVKDADKLGFLMFGGRPFQLGWCNGHNTRLNCLEYHRASEFNLGARDFILLVAHRWEIEDGKLTGRYLGDIVDGKRKAELLKLISQVENVDIAQTIAVGDGANDLPMLSVAGLGIAFHAKPKVKATAGQSLSTVGLDGILYFLGYKDSYIDDKQFKL